MTPPATKGVPIAIVAHGLALPNGKVCVCGDQWPDGFPGRGLRLVAGCLFVLVAHGLAVRHGYADPGDGGPDDPADEWKR